MVMEYASLRGTLDGMDPTVITDFIAKLFFIKFCDFRNHGRVHAICSQSIFHYHCCAFPDKTELVSALLAGELAGASALRRNYWQREHWPVSCRWRDRHGNPATCSLLFGVAEVSAR